MPDVSEDGENVRERIAKLKSTIDRMRIELDEITELIDSLSALCPDCGVEALKSQPDSMASFLIEKFTAQEIIILFEVDLGGAGREQAEAFLPELERQGFSEACEKGKPVSFEALIKTKRTTPKISVICDRVQASSKNRKRFVDSLELAGRMGKGKVKAICGKKELSFSDELACPSCAKTFREPVPNLFSFNSPLGACSACQGFGRVITLDWDLVVPDENKTLAGGRLNPGQSRAPSGSLSIFWNTAGRKKFRRINPGGSCPRHSAN